MFLRSLEAAIFLFSRVARIPEGSLVMPAICTEGVITLGAELVSTFAASKGSRFRVWDQLVATFAASRAWGFHIHIIYHVPVVCCQINRSSMAHRWSPVCAIVSAAVYGVLTPIQVIIYVNSLVVCGHLNRSSCFSTNHCTIQEPAE